MTDDPDYPMWDGEPVPWNMLLGPMEHERLKQICVACHARDPDGFGSFGHAPNVMNEATALGLKLLFAAGAWRSCCRGRVGSAREAGSVCQC